MTIVGRHTSLYTPVLLCPPLFATNRGPRGPKGPGAGLFPKSGLERQKKLFLGLRAHFWGRPPWAGAGGSAEAYCLSLLVSVLLGAPLGLQHSG